MSSLKIIKPIDDRTLVEELADLWRGRGILAVLIRRDISVRYRQAALGVLWALLQPIVTTAIFTVVFVLFGAHLVRRSVVTPLQQLSAEADTFAAGRLRRVIPA